MTFQLPREHIVFAHCFWNIKRHYNRFKIDHLLSQTSWQRVKRVDNWPEKWPPKVCLYKSTFHFHTRKRQHRTKKAFAHLKKLPINKFCHRQFLQSELVTMRSFLLSVLSNLTKGTYWWQILFSLSTRSCLNFNGNTCTDRFRKI